MKKISFLEATRIMGTNTRTAWADLAPQGLKTFASVVKFKNKPSHIAISTSNHSFEKIGGICFNQDDSFHLRNDGAIKVYSREDGPAIIFKA